MELIEDMESWPHLVGKALEISEHIEFNLLYYKSEKQLDIFLRKYDGKIIGKQYGRFYSTHDRIRVPVGEAINDLLLTSKFADWKNEIVEDPSFIDMHDREVLACITHEDMIAINKDYQDWLWTI